ncbi:MAG: hypothetical protein ACE5R6_00025 [Candidatus Heimdallarchaeota archaeon]
MKGDQVAHESGRWIVDSGCVNHPGRISQPGLNLRPKSRSVGWNSSQTLALCLNRSCPSAEDMDSQVVL